MTLVTKITVIIPLVLLSVYHSVWAQSQDWAHLGHSPARTSIAVDGPDTINSANLDWLAWEDPWAPGYFIDYIGPSSPVIHDGLVFAYTKYYNAQDEYTHNQIVAFNTDSGGNLWTAKIDKSALTSWPSPAVDPKNRSVLIGSGNKLFALDLDTGNEKWATPLNRSIVNTSVCVALDIPHARAFITDYTGASNPVGSIYCINLDPNTPDNLYQPGEIVWTDLLGATSGNSPAYSNGVVYVASITDPANTWPNPNGTLHAYNAQADLVDRLWRTSDTRFAGFFGGVTVTKEGYLYAANYDFYGGQDNSALCKINTADGSIVWIAPTERTASIPIVVGDRIYISGGLSGFGSRPKITAYQDLGGNAVQLWQTPETIIIGGWTHQPVYAHGKLYVGAIPTSVSYVTAYTDLFILDTTLTPTDPGFIVDQYYGCGSSPVVTHDSVYSIGYNGLHKFYQPALLADINGDQQIDLLDLEALGNSWCFDGPYGLKRADLNLDGHVNYIDFNLLARQWQKVIH